MGLLKKNIQKLLKQKEKKEDLINHIYDITSKYDKQISELVYNSLIEDKILYNSEWQININYNTYILEDPSNQTEIIKYFEDLLNIKDPSLNFTFNNDLWFRISYYIQIETEKVEAFIDFIDKNHIIINADHVRDLMDIRSKEVLNYEKILLLIKNYEKKN